MIIPCDFQSCLIIHSLIGVLTIYRVIPFKHHTTQVAFQLSSSGHSPSLVTPEQIGTQVLKYLLSVTAEYLGHDQVRAHILFMFKCFLFSVFSGCYRCAGIYTL